jgi:type VI protein secretion system component Hcp
VERAIKLVFRKRAANGAETPVLNVELDNALFASDSIQSASSGQATEAITITYQRISFQEVQQQQSGMSPVSATYDLQAQKAI